MFKELSRRRLIVQRLCDLSGADDARTSVSSQDERTEVFSKAFNFGFGGSLRPRFISSAGMTTGAVTSQGRRGSW
ncbi:hypothetical protein ACU8MP_33145 (plasmid) [Rhizobium leguminosarum]|uniref:hypothetical protein n=1 Tax=Rhizobium leguminosarum TaxID=384 RepID=UPI0014425186|nr:hypothetical protein [Rhizobium leguminosarum]NKK03723.1 hypothetical protein [Rhizobium leguminosarum bv. viciae]NKK85406.1 hypothetical protein [Rhizobium leguminosarum bv. viciae]